MKKLLAIIEVFIFLVLFSCTPNSNSPINQLTLGANYQGGKVAYILQPADPGYISNQIHGFISATADQGSGIKWVGDPISFFGVAANAATNATGILIGTGFDNTNKIIAYYGSPSNNYAAGVARAYTGGGYTDWYLPSKDELIKLYSNKATIGGFTNGIYWTSTEFNWSAAGARDFSNGLEVSGGKAGTWLIRPIRSF